MNYRLPILPVAVGWVISLLVAGICQSQVPANQEVTESASVGVTAPPPAGSPELPNGQQLVAQAAQRLLVAPGIEAKTRQNVQLFGQRLVGSGSYCQLTSGPRLYLRLELKLQVADQVRTLRQISDGDSLWEVRGVNDTQTFSYVNLVRLRKVASETEPLVSPSLWMAMGGLPRMMAELESHFDFGDPEPQLIGEHPVWQVMGQWKPRLLARMLPEQREAILAGQPPQWDRLPEHLPHGVTLVLGRDQIIPLFPYSFSFHQFDTSSGTRGPSPRTPVLTWELFEVRIRPELRPNDFRAPPAHEEYQERTDQFVARLKAAAESMTQ